MNALVCIQDGEPRTTSLAIALGTAVQHKNVMGLVRNYKSDIEEFGLVAFETRLNTQGSNTKYATLNEPQATLIMTYMKNTPIVREFKKRLVRAFYEISHQNVVSLDQIRLLEARINQLESRRFLPVENQRFIPMFSAYTNPITHKLHKSGTTVTAWADLHGFSRCEVSMQINGHRTYPHIQAALHAEGLLSPPQRTRSRLPWEEPAIQNFLYKRFKEVHNGMSVSQWCKMKQIPYSTETVNAAFFRQQRITAPTMTCLMRALGFSEEEITWRTEGLGHAPGQGAWRKQKEIEHLPLSKGGETMVDVVATKNKLESSGRKMAAWAKSKGLDPTRIRFVLNGTVKINDDEVKALREDNLLVEN